MLLPRRRLCGSPLTDAQASTENSLTPGEGMTGLQY